MYIRIFPTISNDSALYKNVLNNVGGIYFSVNANNTSAEKLTATKIKYNLFRLFIISLGTILLII